MDVLRLVLSKTRSCIQSEDMIRPHDKIAVGLSGGKDSVSLLYVLKKLSSFYPIPYEVCAVYVNNGFEDSKTHGMKSLCEDIGVEYKEVTTDISSRIQNTDDPCALCSKLRRRILCDTAKELGCSSLALAHTQDDAAQTALMNLLFCGKFETFLPVTEYENIRVVRPFFSLPERYTEQLVNALGLPVYKNPCPHDKKTHRETVKNMIKASDRINRGTNHRILRALQNKDE